MCGEKVDCDNRCTMFEADHHMLKIPTDFRAFFFCVTFKFLCLQTVALFCEFVWYFNRQCQ